MTLLVALDTVVTTLKIGHSHLNSHFHKLGMIDNPHCPTQSYAPEHLLLHCPRHHSLRMALFHSLSSLHLGRPSITDLLGGSQDPGLVFKAHQDLPPEDRSTQQDLIHLLICNLHFWCTRGCGTTACKAKANSQQEQASFVWFEQSSVICQYMLKFRIG